MLQKYEKQAYGKMDFPMKRMYFYLIFKLPSSIKLLYPYIHPYPPTPIDAFKFATLQFHKSITGLESKVIKSNQGVLYGAVTDAFGYKANKCSPT